MALCSVPDCGARAAARGLCAKHYMRWRRRGDPAVTGQRGRPANRPRYQPLALRLHELGLVEDYEQLIQQLAEHASRPNGSLNVSKLQRAAEERAAWLVAKLER